MGRVDEAMRRAAGAGAIPVAESHADREGGDARQAPEVGTFPSEPAGWPRPTRLVGSIEPPSKSPGAPAQPVPLIERLDKGLSRKIVIDRDIDPASREQYRRVATTLHAGQAASGLKVVMIASALAGEGTSLTAANLALTLSESYQKRVLLIDGDLRRPSQHTVFGLDATPGLTDGLGGSGDGSLVVHHLTATLTVLTAGRATSDPMAALASERMHRLVQEARESFDWVLVDTPPVGLLADASLLAEIADGTLLVVRAGVTPHEVVQRAVAMIGRERLLGVVLNQAEFAMSASYNNYYYAQQRAAPGD
jgi:capsular exopolysaccharide synthesis family protein